MTTKRAMTKPYRPSNGHEGELFTAQWCDRCERDREWRESEENPCAIHNAALIYGIDDQNYPAEWVVDDHDPTDRTARCTAFEPELKK